MYLEADHGEVGSHHRVKVVENVGFTQCILRLCQVTQLHRGGGKGGRGEGGGRGGGREGGREGERKEGEREGVTIFNRTVTYMLLCVSSQYNKLYELTCTYKLV